MKTTTLIFAFALAVFSVNAQSDVSPDPAGNGYGLYHHFSNVTLEEVTTFLEKTGHSIESKPRTEDAGKTWYVLTRREDGHLYNTVVITDGDNIVDFDDTIVD
jgi:hypothetical protein